MNSVNSVDIFAFTEKTMQQPLLFDIKRYSINDGPGIRLTIFFKGCPLRCLWCHNPESIVRQQQKLFTSAKCIGCRECVKRCPHQAISMTTEGLVTAVDKCDLCGACAEICPSLATELSGFYKQLPELMEVIKRERPQFDQSGGGVTVSGGEPLLHPEYLIPLLDACGEERIHRAVDTCGHIKTETLLTVADRTDLFLYDLKLIDSDRHKHFTGVGNEQILGNLVVLAETGAVIDIRIPFIHGVNSDEANIAGTAAFLSSLPGEKRTIHLLPYHAIAAHKYRKLGQHYQADNLAEPSQSEIDMATSCFNAHGLAVSIGG